jgi:hypothetical protein
MTTGKATSALLFVGPGCPHCPVVLEGLCGLIKAGKLDHLEVVNLASHPERGAEIGVRSVPWTRIGPFELTGSQSPADLAQWVDYASEGSGWAAYYAHLLENRQLEKTLALIRRTPDTLTDLLRLIDADDTPMSVRIGISAIMEDLQNSSLLQGMIPELEQLALSATQQIRADACHFLGLTGDAKVIPTVRRLLEDDDPDVREIALETLALLGASGSEAA